MVWIPYVKFAFDTVKFESNLNTVVPRFSATRHPSWFEM
jgi:hypothetical protein